MMRLGKHRGRSFAEVTRIDRPYCAWVLRAEPSTFQRFHAYLQKSHGGLLEMGKHKGLFFDELLASEPDYCAWVVNLKDPGGGFHKLIHWLSKHFEPPQEEEEAEPPSKKPKNTDECKICFDRIVDSVFVPCGHVLACMTCATSVEKCPVCKGVCVAFRTYRA